MSDITQLLAKIESGDTHAAHELLPLVYAELRALAAARMAGERADHTLQPTALVHEAYLRLTNANEASRWNGRGHFFSAAAEAMRRILVEAARRKSRDKHGGKYLRSDADLDALVAPEIADPHLLMTVHEALDRLAVRSPRKAELVKLRYFVGLSLAEAAELPVRRKVALKIIKPGMDSR